MKKIFISFSYSDEEAMSLAQFLEEHLPSLGAEVNDIFNDVCFGDDFNSVITEQINKCSLFICFVHPNNANVMFELGYALGKNKQIIIVGDSHDLPSDVRSMVYIQRGSSPYDILGHVEKHLASYSEREPFLGLDPTIPQKSIGTLIERPDILDNIDGREFEELIVQWFKSEGFNVDNYPMRNDQGFDFIIDPYQGERAVVEVKKYKKTSQVPVSVIRQLVGVMALEDASIGIVVSSAPFTKSSLYFVEDIKPKILLWTLEDLYKMSKMPNK
jgi:restriction system protein